jgi:exopolysaccharide production protein ExoY
MILVLIWIRLISPGPALFRQERIGRGGNRFMLYKFRTMKTDADPRSHEMHLRQLVESDRPMTKLDLLHDSRLIFGGGLLRAAGLDELPQLFNIIKGEMSLVGPRPCLPQEYGFFSLKQRERFQLLPGLTGEWQVNGKNRATFNQMNLMDIHYVRNASLWLDLKIMLQTPSVVILQLREAIHHSTGRRGAWQSPLDSSSQGG